MRNFDLLVRTAAFLVCVAFAAPAAGQTEQAPAQTNRDPSWGWTSGRDYNASAQLDRLERVLERYRAIEARGGWKKVPTDLTMGPEYSYDCRRIEVIERRLIAEGYLRHVSVPPPPPVDPKAPPPPPRPRDEPLGQGGPCKYGRDLAEAMRAFQEDRKVLGYGQLGAQTMAQLNRPVGEIIEILERDVARWRRVTLDPSGSYILVNIPFFDLQVYEQGREVLRMPVITGQPTWQTPLFTDEIETVIINPDWGIPDKIAKLEYWPSAKRDSKYLERSGITVTGNSLRQKPGPRNPLGRIKFSLPNKHDVYLHDTPEKRAFAAPSRALSHGCVRVGSPQDLALYLLRDYPEWDLRKLQAAIASGKTQHVALRQHMPVQIIYSTSRVSSEGRLELRPDVYGYNKVASEDVPRQPKDESLDAWP